MCNSPRHRRLGGNQDLRMLVDYDNVDRLERQRGLLNMTTVILGRLPRSVLPNGVRVAARLYGGWYRQDRLSRVAQRLAREIERCFPSAVSLNDFGVARRLTVSVELARSLAIDPATNLLNTYRVRGVPANLRFRRFPLPACVRHDGDCSLSETYSFLKHGSCPRRDCPVQLHDVLVRPEQKLVDTMLAADIIHAAVGSRSDLIVVTNDDDLWPAIYTAVNLGVFVHHVHPRRGRRTPELYASTVPSNYSQYSF